MRKYCSPKKMTESAPPTRVERAVK